MQQHYAFQNMLPMRRRQLWAPWGLFLHWSLTDGLGNIGGANQLAHSLARSDLGLAQDFGRLTNVPGAQYRYDPRIGGLCLDWSRMRAFVIKMQSNGMTNFNLNPNGFTLSCWYFLQSYLATFNQIIFAKNAGRYEGVLAIDSQVAGLNRPLFFFSSGGGGAFHLCYATNASPLNEWIHLVGTYDGTTQNIYVNGLLSGTNAPAVVPDTNNAEWVAGSGGAFPSDTAPDGCTWQMMAWNRVLTPFEIRKMYESVIFAGSTTIQPGFDVTSSVIPPPPSFALSRPDDFLNYRFDYLGSAIVTAAQGQTTPTVLFRTNNNALRAGSHRTFVAFVTTSGGGAAYTNCVLSLGAAPTYLSWLPGLQDASAGISPLFDLSTLPTTGGVIYPPQNCQLFEDGVDVFANITSFNPAAPPITISAYGWWT